MEDNYFEEERYLRAQKRVKQIKGFYWHLFWYIVVNTFILVMVYNNSDSNEAFFTFGHFSTPIFWGIGLLAHGMSIFGKNIIFSKDWEDRKIKEIMDKDKYDY
jgi:uncharacterized integral membrane protein